MKTSSVVFFSMLDRGHMQRLLPVIASIARRGRSVHVFTDVRFAALVARAGGAFHDLFDEGPITDIDVESHPVPTRYVTFASRRAGAMARRVAALAPGLVVYDTHAVIGRVVARILRLPAVNVCAGHALPPSASASLARELGVHASRACLDAVAVLREEYGIPDASPLSWLEGVSESLNLYCEPPQFLDPAYRAEFEPIAFFGSLAPDLHTADPDTVMFRPGHRPRLYLSLGTTVWQYFPRSPGALVERLAVATAGMQVEVVVSTGGHALPAETLARVQRDDFRVERFVDQWTVLRQADLFITHQGLNSTHEAIWHGLPMLSCPFYGDQPRLAERCRAMGLAAPLWAPPTRSIDPETLRGTLERVLADTGQFHDRLAAARGWERETIAGRDAIVDRMLDLA